MALLKKFTGAAVCCVNIDMLFPTQIVGSYHKPKWLCEHDLVYSPEGTWWKVSAEDLPAATDDATRLAIEDQNLAGLTYATDGEARRQTFSGYFYRLGGIDSVDRAAMAFGANDIGTAITMKQRATPAADAPPPPMPTIPKVVRAVTWDEPILIDDLRFLKKYANGRTKMTVIGPCSLALRVADEHYGSLDKLSFGIADALNKELKALEAEGVDLIQIDEPEVHFRYSQLKDFAQEAIDRTLHGIKTTTAVHVCFGYSKNIAEKRTNPVYENALELLASTNIDEISLEYEQPGYDPQLLSHLGDKAVILGLLNLDTEAEVESVDHIAARVREALSVVPKEKLRLASDCGMWFLSRERAFGKIANLELAAKLLRSEFGN
jgi:5-methyltetrahydropteroyltriglutamate--homocysteine methyltransferase